MADNKLDTIIRRELLTRIRSPWFVVSTLVGPVLFVLMFLFPLLLGERERRADLGTVRVLDATSDSLGLEVVTSLNSDALRATGIPRAEWVHMRSDERRAIEDRTNREVVRGQLQGYLVLDSSMTERGFFPYAGRNTTALASMQVIESTVARVTLAKQLEASGIPAARADSLVRHRVRMRSERLTARGRGGSGQLSVAFALAVALLLYSTIFMHGANVMRGVLEEKESRVAEIVLASVSSDTLLFGKVLGIGAAGMVQVGFWTAVSSALILARGSLLSMAGVTWTRFTMPDLSLEFALIVPLAFLLGFLFYAALFAAVGAVVSSEQEAQQAQLPVIFLLIMSLSTVQGVLSNPDGQLATVLSVIPFSSPIILPLRLSLVPLSAGSAALSLAILSVSALFATFLAARLYRTGVLMYGKRASLREVARWLRGV